MTARIAALAVAVLLVGAAPAPAADRMPTELWSEYPLAPPAAPFTPPVRGDGGSERVVGIVVPDRGDGSGPVPWMVVAPLVALVALIGLVLGRRLARLSAAGLAEFSFPLPPATEASETCVIQLVAGPESSRFVAELEEGDNRRLLAASPSFPRSRNAARFQLGTMGWHAWHLLVDSLEADGWELVPRWGAREGEPITAEEASAAQLVRVHFADGVPPQSRDDDAGKRRRIPRGRGHRTTAWKARRRGV
jgi:hypothetical protein